MVPWVLVHWYYLLLKGPFRRPPRICSVCSSGSPPLVWRALCDLRSQMKYSFFAWRPPFRLKCRSERVLFRPEINVISLLGTFLPKRTYPFRPKSLDGPSFSLKGPLPVSEHHLASERIIYRSERFLIQPEMALYRHETTFRWPEIAFCRPNWPIFFSERNLCRQLILWVLPHFKP